MKKLLCKILFLSIFLSGVLTKSYSGESIFHYDVKDIHREDSNFSKLDLIVNAEKERDKFNSLKNFLNSMEINLFIEKYEDKMLSFELRVFNNKSGRPFFRTYNVPLVYHNGRYKGSFKYDRLLISLAKRLDQALTTIYWNFRIIDENQISMVSPIYSFMDIRSHSTFRGSFYPPINYYKQE